MPQSTFYCTLVLAAMMILRKGVWSKYGLLGVVSPLDDSDSEFEEPQPTKRPEQEDASCLFCKGLFSEDTNGEDWVQCATCQEWAHTECAGWERDVYLCDFCK